MTLDTIASLANILSALAVLVTLIYLSRQIRYAREQLELDGRQHRADAAREVLSSVSDSEFLAPIFAKLPDFPWGEFGLESKEDSARFAAWCHAWMRTEEHNFRALPKGERATQDQLLLMWLSTSWGRSFWNQVKAVYDGDFQRYVDRLQQRLTAQPRSVVDIFAQR
jgi:hypothetical protein